MKKILLIDGFNLIFRIYYAIINNPPILNIHGENISTVLGFFKSLYVTLNYEKPDYYLVAIEGIGINFRNEIYNDYKATRQPVHDDLKKQINMIIHTLTIFNIPMCSIPGYEADDIIGSMSTKYGNDNNIIILSNDKDLRQLVNKNVIILKNNKQPIQYVDKDAIVLENGVNPDQIEDLLAIIGDRSDNIPGVYGIGKKNAAKLLQEFGTLNNIYKNIDNIKSDTIRDKLIANKDNAFLSKKLAHIATHLYIGLTLDYMKTNNSIHTILKLIEARQFVMYQSFEVDKEGYLLEENDSGEYGVEDLINYKDDMELI